MILPDLAEFLQGKHPPQDNDDRLTLLGIYQSQSLDGLAAQLFADAFTLDQPWLHAVHFRHQEKALIRRGRVLARRLR